MAVTKQRQFVVIAHGNFAKGSVRCIFEKCGRPLPKNSYATLDRAWNNSRRSDKNAFDGQLFDVIDIAYRRNRIHIRLCATSYKMLVGTRSREFLRRFGQSDIPDPLCVRVIAQTADRKIVFGLRPGWVQTHPQMIDTPAGYVDRNEDWNKQYPDPFKAATRELAEELQISSKAISGMVCLGAILDMCYHQTFLIFECRLNVESTFLKPKTMEFDEMHFVDSTRDSVSDFLETEKRTIAPTCKVSLAVWLSHVGSSG